MTDPVNLIKIESSNQENKLKVFLNRVDEIKKFNSVELTTFLYPYNSRLDSNSFRILPFEEYIEDLRTGKRSNYKQIDDFADKFFGIFLALIIVMFFALFKPSDLFSVQSVISIFAAYTVGKELWTDLDNLLINTTRYFRISWKEKKYFYSRVDFGTIQKFWEFARNVRYKNKTLLPSQIDFMKHSNSKTIEMLFKKKDLKNIDSKTIQILSYELNNSDFGLFQKDSFMVAFKLVLNTNFIFCNFSKEYFFAESTSKFGIIEGNNFVEGKVFCRSIINFSRIKIYLTKKSVNL